MKKVGKHLHDLAFWKLLALGFGLSSMACAQGGFGDQELSQTKQWPINSDPMVWDEQAKLVPKDGAANDYFGHAVAIEGDTVVVGSRLDDDKGSESGAGYIYTRDAFGWTLQAKLLAMDGEVGDQLGHSLAISGDTALLGSMSQDSLGLNSGAVYVFVRNGGVWTQEAKLLASDGAAGDQFGSSLALEGDTALIGAFTENEKGNGAGAAYVFVRKAGVWSQEAKLLAPDGAADDRFGVSASLSGDTALIGAHFDDDKGNASGAAHVFVRNAGVWTHEAKLTPTDGTATDWFGYSLSVSGDTALVGCYLDDDKGPESGSVYVYTRSMAAWTQETKLLAGDGAAGDYFGISLALSGERAIVGAYEDDDKGNASGAAYIFSRATGLWTQEAKFVAGDGVANDDFGRSVSLSGTSAIVASVFDDDKGLDSGSAYIFAFGLIPGNACGTGNECTSGFCVDGVCCESACGGDSKDDCQVCSIAAGGSSDGVCTPLGAGIECRPVMGVCDIAESCDGQSGECPSDLFAQAGSECRASSGECDAAESCDGQGPDCPIDQAAPDGSECSQGQCSEGVCMEGSGGMGGAGGSGGAGAEGPGRDPDSIGETGTCGCRVPGQAGDSGAGFFVSLGLGLLLFFRRRHST